MRGTKKKGKTYRREFKDAKRTIFYYQLLSITLIISSLSLLVTAFMLNRPYYTHSEESRIPAIIFQDDFTGEQKSIMINAIEDINPIFRLGNYDVVFVKNVTPECPAGIDCIGVNNPFDKKIFVQFDENDLMLRHVICHEFLHTLVSSPNDESIVEQLDNYFPCYDDTDIKYYYDESNLTVGLYKKAKWQ